MSRKEKILREILSYSKVILFSLVASFFIKENVVAGALIPTGSMEETVMTGSRVFVNRLAYVFEEPKRGDIVSFIYPDDGKTLFLKRIMGLPGETIEGIDGYVYIDGQKLSEDYTPVKLEQNFGPFLVPEGCYFMMGDNRNNSWDSRYWTNTFVEKDQIIGKVKLEYFPEFKILK